MCGICFIACCQLSTEEAYELKKGVLPSLSRRGPDSLKDLSIQSPNYNGNIIGSVLNLRGSPTEQPLLHSNGNLFCWNGEIFGGEIKVEKEANDSMKLFEALNLHLNDDNSCITPAVMLSVLSSIKGPWSFLYYEILNGMLWFARDYIGRRSLLLHHQKLDNKNILALSSVTSLPSDNQEWTEVSVKALHCVDTFKYFEDSSTFEDCHTIYPMGAPFQIHDIDLIEPFITIDNIFNNYVDQFKNCLQDAVHKRCFNLPRIEQMKNSDKESNTNVGILFSGGIDSMVLAALADSVIPKEESIDLINVAFMKRNNQIIPNHKNQSHCQDLNATISFDVPDRITGRQGVIELGKSRKWNFIEVDVTLDELKKARNERIANLVYPSNTVLDDSIGCALWFAARGKGRLKTVNENGNLCTVTEDYQSRVKVLLAGMGADEQLGGYARHRGKFQENGWQGLKNEMEMELDRIATRNLGRDDRCISDHGKEARFPFLDENVISFLNSIPIQYKCDPRLPRGFGEKILLRKLATKLGLVLCSSLPKRAIQFGSRIAKLETSKEKGGDSCKRLGKL